MRPSLADLMRILALKPLQQEGGFFVETYRTAENVDARQFGLGHGGLRSLSTAIYYLLTPESFSAIHRVPGDELFHFYAGDPVEMLELFADGSSRITTLGPDIRDLWFVPLYPGLPSWAKLGRPCGAGFCVCHPIVANLVRTRHAYAAFLGCAADE